MGEWKFNTISFYKPDNLNSNELSGFNCLEVILANKVMFNETRERIILFVW